MLFWNINIRDKDQFYYAILIEIAILVVFLVLMFLFNKNSDNLEYENIAVKNAFENYNLKMSDITFVILCLNQNGVDVKENHRMIFSCISSFFVSFGSALVSAGFAKIFDINEPNDFQGTFLYVIGLLVIGFIVFIWAFYELCESSYIFKLKNVVRMLKDYQWY